MFGIVDTNSDPTPIDFVIPANDDANKSVEVILEACCGAMLKALLNARLKRLTLKPLAKAKKGRKRAAKARVEKEVAAPEAETPAAPAE